MLKNKTQFILKTQDGETITETWEFNKKESNILGKMMSNAIIIFAQIYEAGKIPEGFKFKGYMEKQLDYQWFKLQRKLINMRTHPEDPDSNYLEDPKVKNYVSQLASQC